MSQKINDQLRLERLNRICGKAHRQIILEELHNERNQQDLSDRSEGDGKKRLLLQSKEENQ